MKKLLIDMHIHPEGMQHLRSVDGLTVDVIEPSEESRHIDPQPYADTGFLFCSSPPSNLDDFKKLEVIQIASAGYAQVLNLNLPARGIHVCNAGGVNDIPIAQWNLAMMFNLLRNLRQMIRNQEAGICDRSPVFQQDLRGKTVGIWGYGGIGRESARLARTVGMRVHALDFQISAIKNRYIVEGTGDPEGKLPHRTFTPDQLPDFLGGLDFLILSMPLSRHTEGIVGLEQLKMLPPSAFVLNPARGPLIDEQALLQVLRQGTIAGAALDTHYYYPMPPDHPLWRFPNVIMTPHISGSSRSTHFLELLWDLMSQNVRRWLSGDPLLNQLSDRQLNEEQ